MTEPSLEWKINQFVARLEKLDAGDRARLRRIVGARRADARGVESIFYRLVPPGLSDRQEEAFFLVATLFPLADGGSGGNIGQSLQRAAQKHPRMKKGIDRRIQILLDADLDQELPFHLRQTVHFLKSCRVRLDWAVLLKDLLYWDHPDRFVQQSWARAYYAPGLKLSVNQKDYQPQNA